MKIDLEEVKQNAIRSLVSNGGAGVEALRDLFTSAEAELRDVMNIDPKGNMGLQSLASQLAVKMINEMKDVVFPDTVSARSGDGKAKELVSKWR